MNNFSTQNETYMDILKRYKLLLPIFAVALSVTIVGCLDSSGPNGDPQPQPYRHDINPGVSANDFLSDSTFTELVVEVDYMEGYTPNADALDSLEAFLEQRLNKTSVAILDPTVIPAVGQDSYSANEIRTLEEQHRDEFTETTASDRLTAYILIVDGHYNEQNVLGIAYYNTSSAFFGATFEESSDGIGQVSRYLIEATSFRHEFGHLFGLVNVDGSGTDMQQDHQDEENGHHCDVEECLMYYAVETTDLFGQFVGEEIPPLDANCIADLQGNGGR